jgi:CMP-N-acetylneuraminic acid synthetase
MDIKSLAIIPDRGGSKRIPRKNIRSFYRKTGYLKEIHGYIV